MLSDIQNTIRTIENYPKPGITYYDLTPVFAAPAIFTSVLESLTPFISDKKPDKLVAIEARGFILGAALATHLNLPFVPVRKSGKLPRDTLSASYDLEYGQDTLEIHTDAVDAGDRVLIVDDLIATGGTLNAVCDLVQQLQGEVVGIAAIVALNSLPYQKLLNGYDIEALVNID